MNRGLHSCGAIGIQNLLSMQFTLLEGAYLNTGQLEEATHLLLWAEDFIGENDERFYQSEIMRLKDGLRLLQSMRNEQVADACFIQAIQGSQKQGVKILELHAASSLACLRRYQAHLPKPY
jgi:hypothetical protein